MKGTTRELGLGRLLIGVALAFVITFAVMGVDGELQSGLAATGAQEPPACPTAEAAAAKAANPAAEGPNAPMTRAQGAEIIRELRAIRLALMRGTAMRAGVRRTPGPQNVRMQIDPSWHALGRANAPVTMVEFIDLQCPFCRRFQSTTLAEIKKDYIDTGKVRLVALDLPLPMHQYALPAAEAERCAGAQGKFWQFRDAVLDDRVLPTPDVLLKHARTLRLNPHEFQTCLKDNKYNKTIQRDRAEAMEVSIHGTPGFVIGRAKGGWIEGVSMAGARPFPFFQREIETMLKKPPAGSDRMPPVGEANPVQAPGGVSNVRNR